MSSDRGGAIVGGGIAGLAAALFAQKRGLKLPIYERHHAIDGGHHLLWIAPNGMQLLNTLGLANQVSELATPQKRMQFATKELRTLISLDSEKLSRDCQFPIMAIKRRDLWQLLLNEFLRGDGRILYDHELSNLQVHEEGVLLNFGAQRAPVVHSYVIGADGMGSLVRSLLFPESSVRYQGICTWLGESRSPVAARFVGKTVEAWGRGTRFVLTSLDGQKVYWSALERPAHYEKNSTEIPETIGDDLRRLFSDYHADIRAVLAEADVTRIQRCNFGVVSGLPSYCRGSVVLIGDAAHGMPPNMGQGASLGIEDALWVTSCLARNEPKLAFAQYDRMRRARVHTMLNIANSMNVLFQPKSKFASALRDRVAAAVPNALTQMRMAHLYNAPIPDGG